MNNVYYRLLHITRKFRRKHYRMKSESGREERKWITVEAGITGIEITETEIDIERTDMITGRGTTTEIAGKIRFSVTKRP